MKSQGMKLQRCVAKKHASPNGLCSSPLRLGVFALNSASTSPKLLHRTDSPRAASVNNVFRAGRTTLISLTAGSCPPVVHFAFWRITLFTRFRCRLREKVYAVPSSLKELGRAARIARKMSNGSRIIPGDWGKAGPGWLARPLCSRSASSGRGGRIHQFLWHVRACQLREKGTWRLGTMRNRSESSQVTQAGFEPE